MPRRTELLSSTHHLVLNDEDWQYLDTRFGPRGVKPIGVSTVIRAIVHQKVMAMRAAEIGARDTITRRSYQPPASAPASAPD